MIRDNLKKFKVEKGKNLRVTSRAGLGIIGSFAEQTGLFKRLEAGLMSMVTELDFLTLCSPLLAIRDRGSIRQDFCLTLQHMV